MGKELRKNPRVGFERGPNVQIMGIDGSWRRPGRMLDVSAGGALLAIEGSLRGLDLTEFFLLLSTSGVAFRRCKTVRMNGDQVGVAFLKSAVKKKSVPSAKVMV